MKLLHTRNTYVQIKVYPAETVKCVTLLLSGENSQDTVRKITLNSPHLTLSGAGRHPAGLLHTHARTHTHTHTRPGQSPEVSAATLRARIMTSIMSPYSEGEWERELVREKVREREREEREHFSFLGCRGPIVTRPAGAFSPELQLIGCPTMWGGWLRGHGSWGAIDTVKRPAVEGSGAFLFFLREEGFVCAERSKLQSIGLPLSCSLSFHHFFSLSPITAIDLFFSSLAVVCLLQFNMWFKRKKFFNAPANWASCWRDNHTSLSHWKLNYMNHLLFLCCK